MTLFKRFCAGILSLAIIFSLFACGNNDNNVDDNPIDNKPISKNIVHSNYNAIEGLEKDYVYMWYPNGMDDQQNAIINFQSKNYALSFNSRTGMLEAMGVMENSSDYFEEFNIDDLPYLPQMNYSIKTSNGTLRTDGTVQASEDTQRLYARAIESGRNMQRLDVIAMNYQNLEGRLIANNFFGRLEIAANLEYFALNYGVYNKGNTELKNATLSFSIDLGLTYINIEKKSDRVLSATDKNGKGFSFVVPKDVSISVNNSVVSFAKENIDLKLELDYNGFGVVVIPTTSNVTAESLLANESTIVSAVQNQPTSGRIQNMRYDENRGVYVVNTDNMMPSYAPFIEEKQDDYEKLTFSIRNDSDENITVPVAFQKSANTDFCAMGYVPMIRRKDGNQTGISVQISKDWHSYDGTDTAQYPKNHYKRYLEGVWSMCYAVVEVPAHQTIEYEYMVVFAKYGGVYSISHSQLSLIGYASDWIWDQSCLGSWGESVCYDPDRCLNRSLIDDTRPFGMSTKAGGYNAFHWTDNVGGADFLWYYYLNDEQSLQEGRIINQKVNYRTQGPNMSDVVYAGRTKDGCIDTFINIRMGRTDDIIRCYYTLTYEVVKDLTITDLALFKLGAEKYANTNYTKYALGDDTGIKEDETFLGIIDTASKEVSGKNPWFILYDGKNYDDCGNKMFTIREYSADINGKHYDNPYYKLTKTTNGTIQPSFEVSIPSEVGKTLKKGTRFDMVIEMSVLPNPYADASAQYWGYSDYLNLSKDLFNTPESALQQARGNNLTVNASIGVLRGKYPIEIDVVNENVLAQFSMNGGLGYTPVIFNNVPNDSGFDLQINTTSGWKSIVQRGSKGEINDYFSVRKLDNGKYQWIFNVKNSEALNFNIQNEYRLIKK